MASRLPSLTDKLWTPIHSSSPADSVDGEYDSDTNHHIKFRVPPQGKNTSSFGASSQYFNPLFRSCRCVVANNDSASLVNARTNGFSQAQLQPKTIRSLQSQKPRKLKQPEHQAATQVNV